MKFHIVGNSPASEPAPVPGEGVSLAVWQFFELVRGERAVQAPANPWRVESVVAEEHYCLRCYQVRWCDVLRDADGRVLLQWCRCCGKEGCG